MRTILDIERRPLVKFDPSNRAHRKYYAQFKQTGTWGFCPVEFWVPHNFGNVANMVERTLADYYLKKEFRFKSKDS